MSQLGPKAQEKEWLRQCEEDRLKNKRILEDRVRESLLMDHRAESTGLLARMNQEMNDLDIEEKLLRAREGATLRDLQQKQEVRLVQEVKRFKDRNLAKEKNRQQIRETSLELRELESKLSAAYHVRELDVQVTERKLANVREKNRELKDTEVLKEAWALDTAHQRQVDCDKLTQRRHYGQELQDQMVYGNKAKKEAYQEFLRDKLMIDAVVRRVQEEDERELKNRINKMEKTKKEADDFKAAQQVWKDKERAAIEEENRRIMATAADAQIKADVRYEQRRKKEEAMDVVREKIARQMLEKKMEEREHNLLAQEVMEEEMREAELDRHRTIMEEHLRARIEMREAFRKQQEERRVRLEREEADEKGFMKTVMAQMATRARVEQMTKEKQRSKQIEFRHEVEKQMEERRIQRAQELQKIKVADEQLKEHEKSRMQMVEEERIRMLKEHADKLLGYFPPGVLRESDLAILGPEFVALYAPRGSKNA